MLYLGIPFHSLVLNGDASIIIQMIWLFSIAAFGILIIFNYLLLWPIAVHIRHRGNILVWYLNHNYDCN